MTLIPVSRPKISEANIFDVSQALRDGQISGHSPGVLELERSFAEYLGTSAAVAVSSGTTAIDLTVEALDIKSGDECIVPAFTIISTVSALARRGAKIQLVDAELSSWCMNVNNIESIVSQNTKIVLPVHIYGLPVDMQPIWELRKSHNFIILEDSAEALGVTCYGQKSGALGDVSIFSLYANKLITAGEGGMIATSDNILAEKLRGLRNLNFSKAERFVNFELGYAARLNNLGATLALSQLREIDQLLEIKSFLAKRYLEGLDGHPWFDFQATSTSYAENKYWVFGLVLKDSVPFSAKVFQGLLLSHGIESRRFFCPLHLQPVARKFDVVLDPRGMTNSELLWERGLYLPFGTGIRIDEVDEVIRVLWHILTRPH